MTPEQAKRRIEKRGRAAERLFDRVLPIKAGKLAQEHFKENFLKGGFVDEGLRPWQPAKRLSQGGKSAASKQKTLMSSKKHLYKSTHYKPGYRQVVVYNDAHYAATHNNGASIPITPRMRRFAWAKHYEAIGQPPKGERHQQKPKKPPVGGDTMWKRLALTKKKHLMIPARPFIGKSQALNKKITHMIETEFSNLLKK